MNTCTLFAEKTAACTDYCSRMRFSHADSIMLQYRGIRDVRRQAFPLAHADAGLGASKLEPCSGLSLGIDHFADISDEHAESYWREALLDTTDYEDVETELAMLELEHEEVLDYAGDHPAPFGSMLHTRRSNPTRHCAKNCKDRCEKRRFCGDGCYTICQRCVRKCLRRKRCQNASLCMTKCYVGCGRTAFQS